MCSMSVLCPLCSQLSFSSIDALRASLIKAANGPLACPVCPELFLGLDKLTIHLFSHTALITTVVTTASATETSEAQSLSQHQPLRQSQKPIERFEEYLIAPTTEIAGTGTCTSAQLVQAPVTATCDICELSFRNEQLRDMHYRLVHQGAQTLYLQDQVCNTSDSATCNIEAPFKCHLCAKTFKMKGSLRIHLKVVHRMGLPYENNSPKLGLCDRIRRKDSKAPSNKPCNTQPLPPAASQMMESSTVSAFSIRTLTGGILKVEPASPGSSGLNSHVVLLNVNPPVANSTPISTSSEVDKAVAENPKIWECDVCAKSFTTKYFLKKHKRLHTGETPYTCEICKRSFTFQQSYHKHLFYHSNARPHVCAHCGRTFKELSTLHNHERIHSGEKPFKCEVCGKSFRQRVSFLVHTRIHTGAMPYKCELCQKTFRYKVSQRTHKCLPKLLEASYTEDALVQMSDHHFIKSLLESPTVTTSTNGALGDCNGSLETKLNEALLSKAIDDIVVESCSKLGIVGNEDDSVEERLSPHSLSTQQSSDNPNSPTQKLQNMHLNSPQPLPDMDGRFPSFLLEHNRPNNHNNSNSSTNNNNNVSLP